MDKKRTRQLTKCRLKSHLEIIKKHLLSESDKLFLVKNVAPYCGYSSRSSFSSYVIKPLKDLGIIKKVSNGIYKIVDDIENCDNK